MPDEYTEYAREDKAGADRRNAYFDDLRVLLALPEGQRVLFNWLDQALTFGFLSAGGEATIRNAALADYGRERLLEIQTANADGFIKIMKAGSATIKEKL
jgi:hypothetical protein